MSEPSKRRGGKRPGAGAPPSERPLADPKPIRVYDDQSERVRAKGGASYLRRLIDEDIVRNPDRPK
jgi:hypothetical protein